MGFITILPTHFIPYGSMEMSPPHVIYFNASHWPSDHMISSRPLIQWSTQPPLPHYVLLHTVNKITMITNFASSGLIGLKIG